jgi:hypothetical protein
MCEHWILKYVVVLGFSTSLLFGCDHAWAGEGRKTKPVVQLSAQLQGKPSSNSLAQTEPVEFESGWQGFRRGVVDGFTSVFTGWKNPMKEDQPSDAAPANAANVQKVTLGETVILKKIASEDYTLIEGVTLQPSRTSTLQRRVSLSRGFETLFGAGVNLMVVKADIGARISDMLGDEIQEANSVGNVAAIDGNVLEKAHIDWYAKIRPGKVILEANGATHELPFEYTVAFDPRVTGIPRRRPGGPRNNGAGAAPPSTLESPTDPSSRSAARVTTVSAYSPDLFEARFETTPAVVQGEKLPVYRGGVNAKCMGCCEVVAVRGLRIVGRCEGFRPKVGDSVGQLEFARRLDRTR